MTRGPSTAACQPPATRRVTVSTRPRLHAGRTERSDVRAHGSSAGRPASAACLSPHRPRTCRAGSPGTVQDDLLAGDDDQLAEHGGHLGGGTARRDVGVQVAGQVLAGRLGLAHRARPNQAERATVVRAPARAAVWVRGIVWGMEWGSGPGPVMASCAWRAASLSRGRHRRGRIRWTRQEGPDACGAPACSETLRGRQRPRPRLRSETRLRPTPSHGFQARCHIHIRTNPTGKAKMSARAATHVVWYHF